MPIDYIIFVHHKKRFQILLVQFVEESPNSQSSCIISDWAKPPETNAFSVIKYDCRGRFPIPKFKPCAHSRRKRYFSQNKQINKTCLPCEEQGNVGGNPFVCWVSLFSIQPGSKRNWSHFQARRNWLNLFYFPNSNKWNSLSSLCARFCSWRVAARGGKERKTPKQENRVEMYFRSLLDVFPCARSWLSFPSPLGKLVFAMCTRGLLWTSVACSSPRKSTGWEIFPLASPCFSSGKFNELKAMPMSVGGCCK